MNCNNPSSDLTLLLARRRELGTPVAIKRSRQHCVSGPPHWWRLERSWMRRALLRRLIEGQREERLLARAGSPRFREDRYRLILRLTAALLRGACDDALRII